jgi:hypothetical protein
LSDRQAVRRRAARIDFKHVLAMELNDPGWSRRWYCRGPHEWDSEHRGHRRRAAQVSR